ncbi:hypothetical protein SBRY_70178 [Actinacidiphila bryophytorum]|uniref:Uncharacterized protein n=1 Tax=Actinacidiphila bryophytorum TaxID=1436133 RepID=A0A9W4H787_9ACTN|nr:hypothetical protein SBRY_70178 [Actinacidiphila bryophytorum]
MRRWPWCGRVPERPESGGGLVQVHYLLGLLTVGWSRPAILVQTSRPPSADPPTGRSAVHDRTRSQTSFPRTAHRRRHRRHRGRARPDRRRRHRTRGHRAAEPRIRPVLRDLDRRQHVRARLRVRQQVPDDGLPAGRDQGLLHAVLERRQQHAGRRLQLRQRHQRHAGGRRQRHPVLRRLHRGQHRHRDRRLLHQRRLDRRRLREGRHDLRRQPHRPGHRGQLADQQRRHRPPQQGCQAGAGLGGEQRPHGPVLLHPADHHPRPGEQRAQRPAERGEQRRQARRRQPHDVRLLRQRQPRHGSGHPDRRPGPARPAGPARPRQDRRAAVGHGGRHRDARHRRLRRRRDLHHRQRDLGLQLGGRQGHQHAVLLGAAARQRRLPRPGRLRLLLGHHAEHLAVQPHLRAVQRGEHPAAGQRLLGVAEPGVRHRHRRRVCDLQRAHRGHRRLRPGGHPVGQRRAGRRHRVGQPRLGHRGRQRHLVGVHDRLGRLWHLRADRHRLRGRHQPLGDLHPDGHRRHHGLHRGPVEQLGDLRRRQHRLVRRPHLEGQVVDDGRDPRHHR